ncbi:type IV pilus modification PilV family protein [Aeoliella mucimassa]|uniref:Prepilin-type N-terminal cleavage/methylation domain-containing protein n=1 Tax=Aeoliella mucimassa TaxID=2527972 RepID=A0A518AL33_9BACT|nr:type II secretion system protein [Aeoliella mucimassa]QDU55445.1 hypothetical protein Pan181_16340 [Aeoliella mucimassa]
MHQRSPSTSNGFTLIEVILALAILAISLTMISKLVETSFDNANNASDRLEARMVAQSIIDQIKCGALEPENLGPIQLNADEALAAWYTQVVVEPVNTDAGSIDMLLQVRVYVSRDADFNQPACELVRWFQSPAFKEELALMESAAATSASSSSTSTETEEE